MSNNKKVNFNVSFDREIATAVELAANAMGLTAAALIELTVLNILQSYLALLPLAEGLPGWSGSPGKGSSKT